MGNVRKTARLVGFIILIGVSLTAGLPPGMTPVTVTSPISDSMDPTITQGDLVIVVSDSNPQVGEILLFRSEKSSRPVIHRAVNRTASGEFLTKGDANERIDQNTGFEPVTDKQIYGTVLTYPGGGPIVIPVVGSVASSPIVLGIMWAIVVAVAFATAPAANEDRADSAAASRGDKTRVLLIGLAVALVFAIPITTSVTTMEASTSIIVSASAPPNETTGRVVAVGQPGTRYLNFSGAGLMGMTQVATIDGDLELGTVRSGPLSRETVVPVHSDPRDSPGGVSGTVTLYTVPGTLPTPVLASLADIHPLLAAAASAVPLSAILLYIAVFRIDPRSRVRRSGRSRRRRR